MDENAKCQQKHTAALLPGTTEEEERSVPWPGSKMSQPDIL